MNAEPRFLNRPTASGGGRQQGGVNGTILTGFERSSAFGWEYGCKLFGCTDEQEEGEVRPHRRMLGGGGGP